MAIEKKMKDLIVSVRATFQQKLPINGAKSIAN